MELPFPSRRFDVAVMALVIFFVPEPRKGVAEMVRVVSKGGTVAAYAWDMPGGGFPLQPIQSEMFAIGFPPLRPPSAQVSSAEALQKPMDRGWSPGRGDAEDRGAKNIQRFRRRLDDRHAGA